MKSVLFLILTSISFSHESRGFTPGVTNPAVSVASVLQT